MAVLQGSCMCGEIAYESSSEPKVTALCHCLDCQKWTGGPYTSNAVVPEEAFKVTKGTPKHYDVTGASGKNNRHFFCANCGSSLFTKLDIMPGVVVIKAGGLDNGKASLDKKIDVEFYCKDRVSYLGGIDGAKQEPAFGVYDANPASAGRPTSPPPVPGSDNACTASAQAHPSLKHTTHTRRSAQSGAKTMSASQTFFSTPDLLHTLRDQVATRKSIRQLCLVNKSSYKIFSPKLYEELWIGYGDLTALAEMPEDVARPSRLANLRILNVAAADAARKDLYGDESKEVQSRALESLLRQAAGLHTFRWKGSLMPTPFIRSLYEACPRLQSLLISAHHGDVENDAPQTTSRSIGRTSLAWSFSNLTSFSYHHAQGPAERPPQIVIHICKTSPLLTHLSLSANEIVMDQGAHDRLQHLCVQYQQAGGTPLKLKSLVLGESMYLSEPSPAFPQLTSARQYLSMLTDPSYLEALRICTTGPFLHLKRGVIAARDVVGPEVLPRLRLLGFSESDFATLAFLSREVDRAWLSGLALAVDTHGQELVAVRFNRSAVLLDQFVGRRPDGYIGANHREWYPLAPDAAEWRLRPRGLLLPELGAPEACYLPLFDSVRVLAFRVLAYREDLFGGLEPFADGLRGMQGLEAVWIALLGFPSGKDEKAVSFARRVVAAAPEGGGDSGRSRAKLRYICLDTVAGVTAWRIHYIEGGEVVMEELDEDENRDARPPEFDWIARNREEQMEEHPYSNLERWGLVQPAVDESD